MPEKFLAEDLLPDVAAIAAYTGEKERRVRYLIAKGVIPAKRAGNKVQSRKSWIDRAYAEPDYLARARAA